MLAGCDVGSDPRVNAKTLSVVSDDDLRVHHHDISGAAIGDDWIKEFKVYGNWSKLGILIVASTDAALVHALKLCKGFPEQRLFIYHHERIFNFYDVNRVLTEISREEALKHHDKVEQLVATLRLMAFSISNQVDTKTIY